VHFRQSLRGEAECGDRVQGLRLVLCPIYDLHRGPTGLSFAKQAAHSFIGKGLKPADWMSIVTASGESDLDFTNDAKLFAAKLDRLGFHVAMTATVDGRFSSPQLPGLG
jgi:hypothetical protein